MNENDNQFRQLAESLPQLVWTSRADGPCDYLSPQWVKYTGIPESEQLGMGWLNQLHPDDRDRTLAHWNASVETGSFSEVEFRIRRSDGVYRWFSARATPLHDKDGRVTKWCGSNTDIEDLKRSEEALRQSEEKFRALFTWMGEAVQLCELVRDEGGAPIDVILVDVNPAYEKETSLSREKVIGRRVKEVLPVVEQSWLDRYGELVRTRKPVHFEEYSASIGRWFDVYASPMTGNRFAVVFRDISDRKRAETAKATWEAQNRQLQKAESLGRMAGAVAHHFNNQLMTVMGNLELAMDKFPRGAVSPSLLSPAIAAVHEAAEVSRLMLAYLGRSPGTRAPLDLSKTCFKNLPVWRASMPGQAVLETDLPSPGPVVNANANQIQQVLTNLLANAWEANGTGGGVVRLTVKTVSSAEIPVVSRFPVDWHPREQAYGCLEVADTGCGIGAQDLEKVLDPFFSTKVTGRGMGLAVVLGIVRTHEGCIAIKSEPDHGSTFRVFLPLSLQTPENRRTSDTKLETGNAPVSVAQSGTVLLVEDDKRLRQLIEYMLTGLDFAVLVAGDGVEALEVFRKHQPEIRCVLSDVSMPHMDGWATMTALRALRPDLPVILTSGYSEADVMSGVHPEQPQAFLGKPFNKETLRASLSKVLGIRDRVH